MTFAGNKWIGVGSLLLFAASAGADSRVDPTTLTGKVMCGYQGWFNAEGDGAERGWVHWSKGNGPPQDGRANFDLWPDMSEWGPGERYRTGFSLPNGEVAEVFSSYKKETVLRHFEWMHEYGIDGVFVQRFIGGLRDPRVRKHTDTVLGHCREGAGKSGRTFAVMYDLSGMGLGRMGEVREDWRRLRSEMKVTGDALYLHHRGKPVVAVWGIGFNDKRAYTLEECRGLVRFLKDDGCAVMLGVPAYWRQLERDATRDGALHEIIAMADIVSPWTVGRFGTPEDATNHGREWWRPDIEWCADKKLDFLPVVFPGFSWHNLHGGKLDQIPRRKGAFLWSQVKAAKQAGASMLYVAMFDEVDESTAIFKCLGNPPQGEKSRFLGEKGVPSDFYLRLTGEAGKLLRGEIPLDAPLMKP